MEIMKQLVYDLQFIGCRNRLPEFISASFLLVEKKQAEMQNKERRCKKKTGGGESCPRSQHAEARVRGKAWCDPWSTFRK